MVLPSFCFIISVVQGTDTCTAHGNKTGEQHRDHGAASEKQEQYDANHTRDTYYCSDRDTAHALIQAALAGGGADNVSAIVAEVSQVL